MYSEVLESSHILYTLRIFTNHNWTMIIHCRMPISYSSYWDWIYWAHLICSLYQPFTRLLDLLERRENPTDEVSISRQAALHSGAKQSWDTLLPPTPSVTSLSWAPWFQAQLIESIEKLQSLRICFPCWVEVPCFPVYQCWPMFFSISPLRSFGSRLVFCKQATWSGMALSTP